MSVVRAKFFVKSVSIESAGSEPGKEVGGVTLQPVVRGEENKDWSHWTPSGQILMSILNPAAFAAFRDRIGKEMYVDFSDA